MYKELPASSAVCPQHMAAPAQISLGWLLIHSAESLLKCFTLLCSLCKASHRQIRCARTGCSSLSWAMKHEWLSHLCGEAGEAAVEHHPCRCLLPPCSAWASLLKLKPGKILFTHRKRLSVSFKTCEKCSILGRCMKIIYKPGDNSKPLREHVYC